MPSAVLIFNKSSGSHLDQGDALALTQETLAGVGVEVTVMEGDLGEQIAQSLETASDIVVVGGGDGTIRAVIEAHRGRGRPIGILPGGTMNLLANDFGIPVETAAAARTIAAGHVREVDYGLVDGRVFLHTLFTGLPVRIGVHRERRRGKMRPLDRIWLAMHAIGTLPRDPKLTLTATVSGEVRELRSPSFAILVGTIGEQLLPRPVRDSVSGGRMTVFSIHPGTGIDVARMVLRGALGQLASDEDVEKLMTDRCEVRGPRKRMHAMLDGEDTLVASPSTVEVRSGEVQVFAPEETT